VSATPACPGGQTGTSHARRSVACEGTARRAWGPPVRYRDKPAPRPVRGPFSMPIRGPDCLPIDSYRAMKHENDPPTAYEWLEQNFPHLVADRGKQVVIAGIEHQGIGDIIINMQWSTLDMSSSRHELLTVDMPHLRYYGLEDQRCTILFPLNAAKLFIATHVNAGEKMHQRAGVKLHQDGMPKAPTGELLLGDKEDEKPNCLTRECYRIVGP
jgi:hypothetical protein